MGTERTLREKWIDTLEASNNRLILVGKDCSELADLLREK